MPLGAVDVDYGQLVGQRLKEATALADLDQLVPVGGRSTGGSDGRRFERFAEVRQDPPGRPRLGDERDESVATTPGQPGGNS